MVERLGLTRDVEFKGFVPASKLAETYSSFDVFALPSDWEGFGLPILEAQRCAVPVIIREEALIAEEVSRSCLKAGSERDMADKLLQLLSDRDSRERVAEEGLEYSQQFTWERAVQRTLEVYQKAMG